MDALGALIAQRQRDDQGFNNLIGTMQSWTQENKATRSQERIKRLGQALFESGDMSPEGIVRFAKQNKLSIPEFNALREMAMKFQEFVKATKPELIKRSIFNPKTGLTTNELIPKSQAVEPWISKGPNAEEQLKLKLTQGKPLTEDEKKLIGLSEKPTALSTLGKLISERDKLPEGSPERALYDKRIEKLNKSEAKKQYSLWWDPKNKDWVSIEKNTPASYKNLVPFKQRMEEVKNELKTKKMAGYGTSLVNAFKALEEGRDPKGVYKKIVNKFPTKAKELKTLLLDARNIPPEEKKLIKEGVERINSGEDPNEVYRDIAKEYPDDSAVIRRILLTPISMNNIDFSSIFKSE